MSPSASPTTTILPCSDGVRPDRDYFDLSEGEARESMNWIRRNRLLQTRSGVTKLGTDAISERPLGIFQYDHDAEAGRIVCVTTVGFYHWNKGTESWDDKTGGTPLTATASAEVVIRTMNYGGNRVLIFTNGVDNVKKWDGVAAAYSDLGGAPPKSGCMAVAFNRILLGNLISGPNVSEQAVDISEYRNPDAGYGGTVQVQFLLDSNGGIRAMESIGNRRVGVYMDDVIYLATATGGEFPFRFDLNQKGIEGPVCTRACVPTPIGHIYLARDATIRVFNGSTLTVLQRDTNDNRINAYLRGTMLYDKRERSWLVHDPILNELHVHYITIGSDEIYGGFIVKLSDLSMWPITYAVPLTSGVFSRLVGGLLYKDIIGPYSAHPEAYGDFETLANAMIAQDDDGQLYELVGADDAGTSIEHYIETGLRMAGDPRRSAVIRYANHLIGPTTQNQDIAVQFGSSWFGEDRRLEVAKTITLGEQRLQTFHRLRGSWFCLRYSGEASVPLEWRGTQVYADPVGD